MSNAEQPVSTIVPPVIGVNMAENEICELCKQLFVRRDTITLLKCQEGLQFTRNQRGMESSVLDGCTLCRALLLLCQPTRYRSQNLLEIERLKPLHSRIPLPCGGLIPRFPCLCRFHLTSKGTFPYKDISRQRGANQEYLAA